jgi:Cu(I)/Ag(I) efflux system membrane protein CusA/SilA
MLMYLKHAWEARIALGKTGVQDLHDAIVEGAVLRVRPKAMTVAVIVAGLIPIMIGHAAGSDVMQRIAAPMIGGMITAPLLSMLVVPAAYLVLRSRREERRHSQA